MDQPSKDSPETSSVVTSRPRTTASDDRSGWLMVAGTAGQIGYMLAIPAVLFVMGGAWLDKHFGTSPTFTLIGIPLALVISVISVRRLIRQVQAKE